MTRPRDPFDRLGQADPARTRDPAQPTSDRAEATYRGIVTSEPQPRRSPRRWARVPVLVGVALLLAAAAYVLTRPITEPLTVGCYRSASLDADRIVLPANADIPADELCRAEWETGGEFATDSDEPPPLTECVLETGTIAVFPSVDDGDVCQALGLAPPDQPSDNGNQSIIELQDALVSRFLDECLDLPTATATVEEELARYGFTEWHVISNQPFTADRPCASLAIDPTTRSIELVPISP